MQVNVHVRLLNGKTSSFVSSSVSDLKLQIQDACGLHASSQRIWLGGSLIHSLTDGSFLDLTVRINGGSSKNKKVGKKNKKKDKKPPTPEKTVYYDMDMENVILARRGLKSELNQAKRARNYAELDLDQLQTVYDIVREGNERLKASNRKMEAQMEIMKNNFHNECQMFRHKVKETDYNHSNTLKAVELALEVSKESHKLEHRQRMEKMLQTKAAIEEALEKQRKKDREETEQIRDTNAKEMVQLRERFQGHFELLEKKYSASMSQMEQELKLRGRMDLMEIEEMKNMHLKDLCKNHEHAFAEMQTYYQSITKDNLQMITALKEELAELNTRIKQHEKKHAEIVTENKKLKEPLTKAQKTHERLIKLLVNYPKTKRSLKLAQSRVQAIIERQSSLKETKAKLDKELILAETNKNQLKHDLETTVQKMQSRCGKSSSKLQEEVIEIGEKLAGTLEKFQELVESQKVDPMVLTEIQTRVDEVLEMKNKQIEDAKYEIIKAIKQHDDMVRIFESKLRKLGIPEEELGLKTIDELGNTIPMKNLVAD